MKKNIILALFLINLISTSVKASMLPEVSILQIRNDSIEKKYINDGYQNILLGNWHCNQDLAIKTPKEFDVGFCGGLTNSRAQIFNYLLQENINLKYFHGIAYEDIFKNYSKSKR